jgi:hypothetical protein
MGSAPTSSSTSSKADKPPGGVVHLQVDLDTGHTIHTGTTKRRPTAAMPRRIQERNPTCIFPGCRMPSVDCDIDHTRRWADGGVTCACNGAPLCRRHHRT